MSTDFAVKVVKISDILVHPNADRLSLAQIAGWQCVVQKDSFRPGDLAVYVPIDSILPAEVEAKIFGPDSKIKLSKSRVKTIKLRGAISQGLLATCEMLGVIKEEGYDCTKELGITKYEPPEVPASLGGGNQNPHKPLKKNPNFKEYGGLDNFKHYPELFQEGEEVTITEKIHGSNFRFGWVPTAADTFGKRVKRVFGLLPDFEFVFGSNRVQLHNRVASNNWKAKILGWIPIKSIRTLAYQGYYQTNGVGNIYEEAVKKYDLKNRTIAFKGYVFYGEIYGSGIQKGYYMGCSEGERKFVGFDVLKVDDGYDAERWLDHDEVEELLVHKLGLEVVPVLFKGPYSAVKAKELTVGDSVLAPSQKVREGIVIRPWEEEKCHLGRKVLKLLSDEYLLGDNTDFH